MTVQDLAPPIDVMYSPISRATFDGLPDRAKGYVSYVQACWAGSEIPDDRPDGVDETEWDTGRNLATLHVADMEG